MQKLFRDVESPDEIESSLNIKNSRLRADVLKNVMFDFANSNKPFKISVVISSRCRSGRMPKVKKMTSKNTAEIRKYLEIKEHSFLRKIYRD